MDIWANDYAADRYADECDYDNQVTEALEQLLEELIASASIESDDGTEFYIMARSETYSWDCDCDELLLFDNAIEAVETRKAALTKYVQKHEERLIQAIEEYWQEQKWESRIDALENP